MNDYELMKLSEQYDEDGVFLGDYDLEDLYNADPTDPEEFKRKYKDFYTDIKLTPWEDW